MVRLVGTCHPQFNPLDLYSQLEVRALVQIKQSTQSYQWHLRDQLAMSRLEALNNKLIQW